MSIGKLIKHFRNCNGVTMEELAKDICTRKYISYIEADKRYPSVRIINMIGRKLNENLFDFLPYMDCDDPTRVKRMQISFEFARKNNDYEQLEMLNIEAIDVTDYNHEPWCYEISYNEALIALFRDKDCEKSLDIIAKVLNANGLNVEIDSNSLSMLDPNIFKFYNMLAVYMIFIERRSEAIEKLEIICAEIFSKREMREFEKTYISVNLNLMQALQKEGDHERLILIGNDLINFQISSNKVERLSISYAILAASYYQIEKIEISKDYYYRSIFLCIALNHKTHLNSILKKIKSLGFNEDIFHIDLKNHIEL